MLTFRVGIVDETLPTRGITHLVEHLAMFPLTQGGASDRMNAAVEPQRTRFMCTGAPDEVKEFLQRVAHNLSHLPMERLDNEKKVLRTEGSNRPVWSTKSEWTWRYGPAGLGLVDWEEFGLRWLGPEAVTDWSTRWFTRGNAVLWISGPVPEGLELPLPSGERKPTPHSQPLPYQTPGEYQQGDKWVMLSMLGPRTADFLVASRAIEIRLRERLRNQSALAYDVHANYLRLDRETAQITAFADALAQGANQAANELVAEVWDLADKGPDSDELEDIKREGRRVREHPEAGFGLLDQAALAELEGLERKSPDELEAEVQAVTPASVAAVLRSARATSFLAIPNGVPMTTQGFVPIPVGSGTRHKGVRVVAMPGAGHDDIIDFDRDGISLSAPNGTVTGMRWSEIAAALWWTEGRRTLVGSEGSAINIIPSKWREVGPLLAAVQQNVPAERWVPMDEPGSLPSNVGPLCVVCQSSPAIEVTLFNSKRWARVGRIHGLLCRDCGIARFREGQKQLLTNGILNMRGWYGLVANIPKYQRFRKMPLPIRTSGINPLPKGSRVLAYPPLWIEAAVIAGVIAYVALSAAR